MKLITAEEVLVKLEHLRVIADYQQVLMMANVDLANPSEGHQLYMKSQRYCGTIQGKAPTDHSTMETVNIPSPLPALNGNQVCTLYQYLQFNGGQSIIPTKEDGDCLYGAFRRGTDLPVEVVDVHVRRLLLKVIVNFHEFFYDLFKTAITMQYGVTRDSQEELQKRITEGTISEQDLRDQRMPGPFSFFGYLKNMLQDSSYGDDLMLLAISMVWQMRVTVLDAETLFERRFRHNNWISKTDLLIIHCPSTQHFLCSGKRLYIFVRVSLFCVRAFSKR